MVLGHLKKTLDNNEVNYSVYYVKGGANITFELPENSTRCSITCKTDDGFYDLNFTLISTEIVSYPKFIPTSLDLGVTMVSIFDTFINIMAEIGDYNEKNTELLQRLAGSKFNTKINYHG